jgi:aspartate/methionine/tyrosine aminotransferase
MNLQPFLLERYFAQYEFNVQYLLCGSDCESFSIQDILALEPDAQEKFNHQWLGYTESTGSPTLRQEIANIYRGISADQILVHSGAEEVIFLFMHAVLSAGDHVIVHNLSYQSLHEVARSIGCEITYWQADESNGWSLKPDQLKRMIRPNTKAIVINTPHNPTGYLMDRAAYAAINEIANAHGAILFSDEVYRESEYDPNDRLPSACEINPSAISLGVMSKTYGLPGLRIGWAATQNKELYNKLATLKDYTTICNSAPSEFLSEVALRHRQKLIDRNLGIIKRNIDLLDGFFARHADRFRWQKPRAGSIAFPQMIGGEIESFCDQLVRAKGVLLLPGALFGDDQNHFRIGFGRSNMPQALEKLEEFL